MAAKKAEDKVSLYQRGLVLSVKDIVKSPFCHKQASVTKRSSTAVKFLQSVESERHDTASGQSVPDGAPLEVSRVILSHDVILLF